MAAGEVKDEGLEGVTVHAVKKLGYNIKELQFDIVQKVVTGYNIFAVLPTGFGKSLCYGCLPLVFDEMYKPERNLSSCPL